MAFCKSILNTIFKHLYLFYELETRKFYNSKNNTLYVTLNAALNGEVALLERK